MDLITLKTWSSNQVIETIEDGLAIKTEPERYNEALQGQTLAMLFQKTSTRTRASFEVGMTQLGGHAMYLDWRATNFQLCLLYTSPSPRDATLSRMPSSA